MHRLSFYFPIRPQLLEVVLVMLAIQLYGLVPNGKSRSIVSCFPRPVLFQGGRSLLLLGPSPKPKTTLTLTFSDMCSMASLTAPMGRMKKHIRLVNPKESTKLVRCVFADNDLCNGATDNKAFTILPMRLLVLLVYLKVVDCWVSRPTVLESHRPVPFRLDALRDDEACADSIPKTTKGVAKRKVAKNNDKKAPVKGDRKKPNKEISYWLDNSDEVVFEYKEEILSAFRFKVRGNPRPLVRHRTSRGMVYNPSSGLQKSFRDQVIQIMASVDKNLTAPLFLEEDCLVMSVVLRMKRPMNHFVGSKPGPDRLKASAPRSFATRRSDVDNMVKFVMDSMNKLLYPDDRQIASLHVTKVLDNDGLCEGSTEICLRAVGEDDFDILTANTIQIVDA